MKRVLFPLCLAALLLLSACREAEAGDAKPVIYLYPEDETEVTVRLDYDGTLTCTYPAYEDGWTVTAAPDGTLRDESGQTYSYLYWEGVTRTEYDFSGASAFPERTPPPSWRTPWPGWASPAGRPTNSSSTGFPGWRPIPIT